jgi:hypothetical protein
MPSRTKRKPALALSDIVAAGGGELIGVSGGMVSFRDPQTGETLVLALALTTSERVAARISESRRRHIA